MVLMNTEREGYFSQAQRQGKVRVWECRAEGSEGDYGIVLYYERL